MKVLVACQDNEPGALSAVGFPAGTNQLQTAHNGHFNIRYDNVRVQLLYHFQGNLTVYGSSGYFNI